MRLSKIQTWTLALLLPPLMIVIIQALMYGLDLFSTNIAVIMVVAVLPSYVLLALATTTSATRVRRFVTFTAILIPYAPLLAFPYFLQIACLLFGRCHLL